MVEMKLSTKVSAFVYQFYDICEYILQNQYKHCVIISSLIEVFYCVQANQYLYHKEPPQIYTQDSWHIWAFYGHIDLTFHSLLGGCQAFWHGALGKFSALRTTRSLFIHTKISVKHQDL